MLHLLLYGYILALSISHSCGTIMSVVFENEFGDGPGAFVVKNGRVKTSIAWGKYKNSINETG